MSEPLGVSPDELRAAADHLAETSSRLKQVLASLSDGLAGAGAPWGDDHLGKQFADGAAGYIAQVDYVHTSIDAKSGLLDGYSDGMRTAANTLEQQDTGGGSNGPGTNSDLVDPSTSNRPPAKRRSGTTQALVDPSISDRPPAKRRSGT